MKVLFFDIDGTLIENSKGITTIPQEVKDELKRIQSQGNKLFLATGRPKLMLTKDMLSANFDGYVCFNGGYIELDGEKIYENAMDEELARASVDLLERFKVDYMIETGTSINIRPEFTTLYNFFCNQGLKDMFTMDYNFDEIIKHTIKIECNIDASLQKEMEEFIQSGEFGKSINYDTHGTDFAYELYSPTISKAVGIQKVLDYLYIDPQNAYAFGDCLNDLPMFEVCGIKVCMGNGVDALKEKADIICDPIEEQGLSKILKELF